MITKLADEKRDDKNLRNKLGLDNMLVHTDVLSRDTLLMSGVRHLSLRVGIMFLFVTCLFSLRVFHE